MDNVLNKNLKELPYNPTRGQIYTMFYKLDKRMVLAEINATMCQYRGKKEEEIKKKRRLLHPEWVKILKYLGMPEGYKKPEWLTE